MLPNRLIIRTYVVRGFKLWVLTRLAIAVVALYGAQPPVIDSPVASFYIV